MINYLDQYRKEKQELLTNPLTFRQKYPGWEEGVKVKDIFRNIDNHISFWKSQQLNTAQPNNKILKNNKSPLKPTPQLPEINPNIICPKCNLPMRLRQKIGGTAHYCDNYAYCGGIQQ